MTLLILHECNSFPSIHEIIHFLLKDKTMVFFIIINDSYIKIEKLACIIF